MSDLSWSSRPALQDPIVLAAFAGWNDAGEGATSAIRYLATQWNATDFALLDSEDFYDFSSTRPIVRMHDGVSRDIEWPVNRFMTARAAGNPSRDMVLLLGVEPQLKWRTFCSTMLAFSEQIGASAMITMGALLADVPHTRIPQLSGSASSPELFQRLGVRPSQYEGPTGIIGALQQTATAEGFPSASLWAAVPHYVGHISSPKATLALVEHVTDMLSLPVDTSDLRTASQFYESQVDEAVGSDEELRGYIRQLEESEDEEDTSVDRLAAEVEQFLREHDQ
jgi:proteasome assembly chaperone (PAC2) family protein